jgi:hypothetical protein
MEKLNIDTNKSATLCGTLNDKIDLSQNTAYTPTFKIAIDAFLSEIGPGYSIEDTTLQNLSEYMFKEMPLREDEYKKEIEKEGNKLKVTVSFEKDLPFERPSRISEEPFMFGDKELCHFKPRKRPDLLYYNDKDDFAISLSPKDESQEIIMIKSPFSSGVSFEELFQSIKEPNYECSLDFNATIKIPIIEFDWSTKHPEIEHRTLQKSPSDFWDIAEIKEELKFSLTNTGAKVKSGIAISGMWNCVLPENPQQIIFDKPFVVFLKKVGVSSPYFAAYIADATFLRSFDLEGVNKENEALYSV